tara:strand:+ start:356 stop:1345 length:990 start_codon:yes stop_codon:yes gene_type:complete
MGYKTKSMIYAKSLKASLNATSEKKAKGTAEAILDIGLGYTDVKPNAPESTNVEKMTPKPLGLIKKAPEKKAEATKREKRKSDRKDDDSGVLSGLASESKGTQTGTALGIMVKKIAGAVKGKKAKAATTATAAAAKTSAANKAKDFSETPAPMPAKTDSFRFYEDSGMNKSTPKKATAKSGSSNLSKMAAGSPERIAEYKKRNWAMDATTGGAAKKATAKKAATQYPGPSREFAEAMKKKSEIGKPGPSNVNSKEKPRLFPKGVGTGAVKGSGTAKDPIKPKTVKAKKVTKTKKSSMPNTKAVASAVNSFFEVAGPFGKKGWLTPGGKK